MKSMLLSFVPDWVRLKLLPALWGWGVPHVLRGWLVKTFFWRPLTSDKYLIKELGLGLKLELNPQDHLDRTIWYSGCWEPEITWYLRNALKSGDVFIDIGAHIGYYSCIAAKIVGFKGSVIAFEPNPLTYARLSKNLMLNVLTNISCRMQAVFNGQSKVLLQDGPPNNSGLSMAVTHASSDRNTYEVEAVTLSSVCNNEIMKSVRLIKIDTEGAELEIIEDLANCLQIASVNLEVIVEVSALTNGEFARKHKKLIELFDAYGFTPYFLGNGYTLQYYNPERFVNAPIPINPDSGIVTSVMDTDKFGVVADILFSRRSLAEVCTIPRVRFKDVLKN